MLAWSIPGTKGHFALKRVHRLAGSKVGFLISYHHYQFCGYIVF